MIHYLRRLNIPRLSIHLILLTCLLAISLPTHALSKTLVRGRSICDQTETACLDGSITWYKNRDEITINGRLRRTVEPGKLIFMFSGHLATGQQVFYTEKIDIRGKRGEIISARFQPPYSNQTIWALHQLTYTPGDIE